MKNTCFTLLLSFCTSLSAQNTDLLGTWYLHYINVEGEQYMSIFQDSGYFVNFSADPGNGGGQFLATGEACYSHGFDYTPLSENSISIEHLVSLAEGCSVELEEDFFWDYGDVLIPNADAPEVHTYTITGLGNDEVLQLTNADGNHAIYGKQPLQFPNFGGHWYLHSINIGGAELQNVFNPMFNLDIDTTNPNFLGLIGFGDAICNGHSLTYQLASTNSIKIIEYAITLAGCSSSAEDEYESQYSSIFVFQNTDYLLMNVEVSGSGENETLILTNTDTDDYAFYGRQVLSSTSIELSSLKLLQNPVTNHLTVAGLGEFQNINYTLIDLNGRRVSTGDLPDTAQIDVSQLQSGVYFIQLNSNNQKSVLRFIKL